MQFPARLHSLDVLRGVAALAVVLWHWRAFFGAGVEPAIEQLPLSAILRPVYTRGWMGVDLFFCLSGFVFYWLYSKAVSEKRISFGEFALRRFSRLYPLHLVTLLAVAAVELYLRANTTASYFGSHNDVKHFVLNLFFASSWGLEKGYSFNHPIWSVSVEILLYGLFFACCRLLPIRFTTLAIGSIFGYFFLFYLYPPIGRGTGAFFMGGIAFLAYEKILRSNDALRATKWVLFITAGVWLSTIVAIGQGLVPLPEIVLFAFTILSLALVETLRGPLGSRLSFLGDISYSTYLLHFPLQLLVIALVGRVTSENEAMFYSSWFMLAFFCVLIILSLASYHYFELPAQEFMRRQRLRAPGARS